MRISRTLAAVAAGLALAAAAGLYAFAGSGALAADRRPGRIEQAVAQRLVRLSIPARESVPTSRAAAEGWRDGLEHFGEHCAMCHGADGRGRTPLGRSMYPPVPDLSSAEMQRFTDAQLFAIIRHGVSWTGMPAFGSTHSDEDTWKLVAFIRRTPRLTPADLERHHDTHDAHDDHGRQATVVMDGTQFQPAELTVRAGETVVWVNKDPFPHNVASDAAGFHSGEMAPDASWSFRPTTPGTFRYVCTLHPTMAAVLHVQ